MSFEKYSRVMVALMGDRQGVFIPELCIEYFRDYHLAAVFKQLCFWSGKGHDPDGWIYKTSKELASELFLDKRKVDRLIDHLRKESFIEIEIRQLKNATTARHFRVNMELVCAEFSAILDAKRLSANTAENSLQKVKTSLQPPNPLGVPSAVLGNTADGTPYSIHTVTNIHNNNNTHEPEIKKPIDAEWKPDTEILKTKLEPHADIKKLLVDKKTYRVALNEFKTNQIESYGHIKKTPAGWVTSFVARLLACKRVDASNATFLNYPELRSTQAIASHTAKKPTVERHGSSAYKELPRKPILKTGTQAERDKTKAKAKLARDKAVSGFSGR